jgi:hypothetical protein
MIEGREKSILGPMHVQVVGSIVTGIDNATIGNVSSTENHPSSSGRGENQICP